MIAFLLFVFVMAATAVVIVSIVKSPFSDEPDQVRWDESPTEDIHD